MRNAESQGEVRSSKLATGFDRRAVHSAFRTPHSALASSHQLQDPEPLRLLAIAANKHPAVAAAPDQLPGASRASRQHLVHEQVEPQAPADMRALPFGPRDAQRHRVPAVRTPPGSADVSLVTRTRSPGAPVSGTTRYPTRPSPSSPATYTCRPSEWMSSGSLSRRSGGAPPGRMHSSGF